MKEVLSSYQHENFRATTIMLWSVVIADIIFKLQFLYYSYGSEKAKKILEDIEHKKTKEELKAIKKTKKEERY